MTTLKRSSPETERSMDQPVMTFDLPAILADLKQEPTWRTARRNAVTLLKQPRLRAVLVALQGGAQLASHQTELLGRPTSEVEVGIANEKLAQSRDPDTVQVLDTCQGQVWRKGLAIGFFHEVAAGFRNLGLKTEKRW